MKQFGYHKRGQRQNIANVIVLRRLTSTHIVSRSPPEKVLFNQNSDKLKLNVRNVFYSEKEPGRENGINDYRNVKVSARPSTIMIILMNVIGM